jgi:ribosomal protein L11 methyltransferase
MHALALLVPAGRVEAVSDRLADELGALAVSIEDADAGSDDEQPVFDEPGVAPSAGWRHARVSALFADEAAATSAATALAASDAGRDARIEAIAAVDERDWVRLTQAQFGPTEVVPGFWIVPTWSGVPAQARHVIRLDPGMAFGTGTHPTTRMCLRWIARQSGDRSWARVLDYGCGSGILAIGAALHGAHSIEAVDIDPLALEATQANARTNDVQLEVGRPEAADGVYALIVANILATPLKLLAPLLCRHLDIGGDLVLSGLLERQAAEVASTYKPWIDLRIGDREEGWILMVGSARGARMASFPR